MKYLNYILVGLLLVFLVSIPRVHAGAGKSFGLFAGGVGAGIIGTKIFSGRGERNQQSSYAQQPQVIYVQQPQQPQVIYVPVQQESYGAYRLGPGARPAAHPPERVEVTSKTQADTTEEQARVER